MKSTLLVLATTLLFISCKKEEADSPPATTTPEPRVVFQFQFDNTQERQDNFGNPSTLPAGHSAQSPVFHGMSAHYIEFAQNQWTQLGQGAVVYQGAETTAGGSSAVDFSQANVVGENEEFHSIPLSEMTPGTYEWLRVSLSYQNYDIDFTANGLPLTGRLASFVGFNNYIESFAINNETVTLNQNKLQGYWAFEAVGTVAQGDASATTVPNPISGTSPIPAGSCVVTGQFAGPVTITGNETEDIVIVMSLSTNNSFEWKDDNMNGVYEPLDGDTVVDMGLRGLLPIKQ